VGSHSAATLNPQLNHTTSPSLSPSPSYPTASQYPYQHNHYYDQNENYTESSETGVVGGPPHSSASSTASVGGNIAQGYAYSPEDIAQIQRQIENMNLDPKQQELYR